VLTTGGEAGRIAGEHGIDTVPLRKGFQPRYALYNSFFTLLQVFRKLELTSVSNAEVLNLVAMLKDLGEEWSLEEGIGFKTALQLKGYTPVIYTAQISMNQWGEDSRGSSMKTASCMHGQQNTRR
jgi:hypothetical protein